VLSTSLAAELHDKTGASIRQVRGELWSVKCDRLSAWGQLTPTSDRLLLLCETERLTTQHLHEHLTLLTSNVFKQDSLSWLWFRTFNNDRRPILVSDAGQSLATINDILCASSVQAFKRRLSLVNFCMFCMFYRPRLGMVLVSACLTIHSFSSGLSYS